MEEIPIYMIKKYNYKGKNYTMKELSKISGIKYDTIQYRICHLNWSVEKAVETPLKKEKKYKYKNGMYTVVELSEMTGIPRSVIHGRLTLGWGIKRAVETRYNGKAINNNKDKQPHTKKEIKENRAILNKTLDEIYQSSLMKRPVY